YSKTIGTVTGGGGSGSALFAVNVNTPLSAGTATLSDNAAISDDGTNGTDSNLTNNSATKTTSLVTHPDLSVTIGDGGATPAPGQNLVYTLNYANGGNIG